MKEVFDKIELVADKLGKLTDLYQTTKQENGRLESIIEELNRTVTEQRQKITKLEEQIKVLSVSRSVETGEGNKEAKTTINELVREIDKCIALLNS